jgi:hypothetical protein
LNKGGIGKINMHDPKGVDFAAKTFRREVKDISGNRMMRRERKFDIGIDVSQIDDYRNNLLFAIPSEEDEERKKKKKKRIKTPSKGNRESSSPLHLQSDENAETTKLEYERLKSLRIENEEGYLLTDKKIINEFIKFCEAKERGAVILEKNEIDEFNIHKQLQKKNMGKGRNKYKKSKKKRTKKKTG